MPDPIEIEADGVLMDRIGRDRAMALRDAVGLGPPVGAVPWIPLDLRFSGIARLLESSAADFASDVRSLARAMRRSRPSDWSILAVRCEEACPVIYKLYARHGRRGWVCAESDVSPISGRPYLWDRHDYPQFDDGRWAQLRSRCVVGDLTVLAGLTADNPDDKPGLHGFMRLSKAKLLMEGVSPIEPMRWAYGWEPEVTP